MENIVSQIGIAIDGVLGSLSVKILVIVCASLAVVAFVLQTLYIALSSKNIKNYRRIKKFVVKKGDVCRSNSHAFYKKCVKHMSHKVKKSWKKLAIQGKAYEGSDLQYQINKSLTKDKRPMMFYYYTAFSCVAALQTLLLCKGLAWTSAICYSAVAAGAWAVVGIFAKLYSVIMYRRNKNAAAGMLEIFNTRVTLADKSQVKVVVLDGDSIRKVQDVPANTANEKLCESVNAFVDQNPDVQIAKLVSEGVDAVAKSGCVEECDKEMLAKAQDALKKYTA